MAFNTFLRLDAPVGMIKPPELKGETTDKAFAGAIEIAEFSFGLENAINIGSTSGGAGAGKATFKEFTIRKHVDLVTPALIKALCTGSHFGDAWLYIRKAGGTSTPAGQAYVTVRMKMVFVTNIEFAGSSGDDVPVETVTFKYGAIDFSYKPQDPTGKLGMEVKAIWSQVKNAAVLE